MATGVQELIQLHPHSQKAFEAVCDLLPETHRAAVIHPTGAGKSFIAFRLTEHFADRRFVWLSPSETIYLTQRQNVLNAYGYAPENVLFSTYTKLLYTSEKEMQAWQPDIIILDEFHRCGAKEWGAGVARVLSMYPDADLVGFSATNVRYLDNQRDMAMELFDGCIADQITLPEAIATGILPCPKYVIALYTYGQELERLQRRIQRSGQAAKSRTAALYEKLRKSLEKAPPLNELFNRHMPDKNGKYLVFCSDIERLEQMAGRAKKDFSQVDDDPHVYVLHEGVNAARDVFERFKQDSSDHLKLMYCVDMLNEGVHVDNLSGVILFRPTVSPIIYKQQIGRALSAGDGKIPVVFDLVNNFSELFTVSALSSEFADLVSLYRNQVRGTGIPEESFTVVDELRDCREILQEIESALDSTWDEMYRQAEIYFAEHGNLLVPKGYHTEDGGLPLGQWIQTQRRIYRGTVHGSLTPERVHRLERIGMVWVSQSDRAWENGFRHAEAYFQENNNLEVAVADKSADGYPLGKWISAQRERRKGTNGRTLTDEQIERLDGIGMVWSWPDEAFERGYTAARAYLQEHGDLLVPNGYVTADGVRLGSWIRAKRLAREQSRLTEDQTRQLNELGMVWGNKADRRWQTNWEAAKAYADEHGNLSSPDLRNWLVAQKRGMENGRLTDEKRQKLEALGKPWMDWLEAHTETARQKEGTLSFEAGYPHAAAYVEKNGHLRVPDGFLTEDGYPLSRWLTAMRSARNKKLTMQQISALDGLGIYWRKRDEQWDSNFFALKEYLETHGSLEMPESYRKPVGARVNQWMRTIRDQISKGTLPEEKLRRLRSLGGAWDRWLNGERGAPLSLSYETGLPYAKAFFKEHGHLRIPKDYYSSDGYPLGKWTYAMRDGKEGRHHRSLTAAQVHELDRLGFYWSRLDEKWDENYVLMQQFFDQNGSLDVPRRYENGSRLQDWLRTNREQAVAGKLTKYREGKLERFGEAWKMYVGKR